MKKITFSLLALAASGLSPLAQTLNDYQATVTSQAPSYYFTFDNGTLASMGSAASVTLSVSGTSSGFGYDAWRNPGNAVYFTAKPDALVDPNELADKIINGGGTAGTNSTAAGSLSFLFKTLSPGLYTAQKYVLCAGFTTANHNALSLFFENTNVANGDPQSLKLRFGDRTATILPSANVVPDTWYYFAFTYTEATNGFFWDSTGTNLVTVKGKWYLGAAGGVLAGDVTTNAVDAVAGEGTFYLGERQDLGSPVFANPGTGLVDEFATWTRRLSDTEITNQFTKLPNLAPAPRSTYQTLISAQAPNHYFKFDGDFKDAVSGVTLNYYTNVVGFTYDYFGGTTNAVLYVLGGDALTNNGNLLNGGGAYNPNAPGNGRGSLSFLFRTLNSFVNQGNRYLFTAGGNPGTSNRFELFFNTYSSSSQPEALKLGFGDSSTVILATNNFVPATWYYFAMTYDEAKTNKQVSWWFGPAGGTLQSGTLSAITNSLAGEGDLFIFGDSTNLSSASFRNSTPSGQGRLDEFAFWNRVLDGSEVTNQFNALVASAGPAPTLTIALSGSNVIISWPATTDPGYALYSAPNLQSAWSGAGSPAIVGGNYVVTNAAGSGAMFYRLKK